LKRQILFKKSKNKPIIPSYYSYKILIKITAIKH